MPDPDQRGYILITPSRDEAANLRRLAPSVAAQTVLPARWIIVDDGSTDDTGEVASKLAEAHDWVRVVMRRAEDEPLDDGRMMGRDIAAFDAGVAVIDSTPAFVVKLDADVSFASDYFERLLAEFDRDQRLGIAGGTCYEEENGAWVPRFVTGDHVRGATRVWRWECFRDVTPLPRRLGWDTVDELKAATLDWRTRSFPYPFYHHRGVGAREGSQWSRWVRDGRTSRFLGYSFVYLLMRALYRMRHDPAASGLVFGYLAGQLSREPRLADPVVRAYLRRQQSLRLIPQRSREALGRGAPT